MEELVVLLSEVRNFDEIGQLVASVQVPNEVWARISSTSRQEWNSLAKQDGFQDSFKATMPLINYNGERIILRSGEQYTVYRTYVDGDNIELYAQRNSGDYV